VKRDIRYPLLAETQAGYQNLCRLITRYKSREKKKGEGFSTAEEIRELMSGNICRCGAYTNIIAAIQQAMGRS